MRKERLLEKCRSETWGERLLHGPHSQTSLFSSPHLPVQVRKAGSKQLCLQIKAVLYFYSKLRSEHRNINLQSCSNKIITTLDAGGSPALAGQ